MISQDASFYTLLSNESLHGHEVENVGIFPWAWGQIGCLSDNLIDLVQSPACTAGPQLMLEFLQGRRAHCFSGQPTLDRVSYEIILLILK